MRAQKQQFWHNVLPSMAAFAFSGLYTIVDGFFVGQNIGDFGLAAVNIAYPITAFIQAIGTGIGMAGAIWIAISAGENNEEKKNRYLGNTVSLLLLFSLFVTVLLTLTYYPLLQLLGAQGVVLEHAASYLKIIIWGTVFQLCSVGLLPLIRNYNGAFVAMLAMVAGFVSNIFLDWYFTSVLQQGTAGAALATVMGQAVALVPCILFILRKREIFGKARLKPRLECVKKIGATALSPFGAVLSPVLTIIILNKAALAYGGNSEVACYAVISYVTAIVYLLLQGIGDGVQPLIGKSCGAGDIKTLGQLRKMAFQLSLFTALCCFALLMFSRTIVPYIFGASQTVSVRYQELIFCFLLGIPFIAISKVAVSYFYATGQNRTAYLLIYSEPLVLALAAGFVFPMFFGANGVWLAVPFTQFLLAAASMVAMKRKSPSPVPSCG